MSEKIYEHPWPDAVAYIPRPQGFDATIPLFYETAFRDPDHLEIFCYTDRTSYQPGDEVCFHVSTTGCSFSLEIFRDGAQPVALHRVENLSGHSSPLQPGFHEKGCDWPVVHRWRIPADAPSSFCLVIARASGQSGAAREQEHGFAIRPAKGVADKAPILLVLSTCTWNAYNDWGGANHYQAHFRPEGFSFAPRLSYQRPFARGLLWTPRGVPRKATAPSPPGAIPRYPPLEFAFARGYSKWYCSAGWATYEKLFAVWAEENGYRIDVASQLDLHFDPELLRGYRCVVFVGHDEYWTWEMREAVDRFVDSGGNVARFAGNFLWQIRIEDDGRTQVCFKDRTREHDPIARSPDTRRATSYWDDPLIHWPGAMTFGLNATQGMYAGIGNLVPRGTGGFTVYREHHWSLTGTTLQYGDVFGSEARIFGYEVDGLDFSLQDGLPVPTLKDGAPASVEIIAMGLAANRETLHALKGAVSFYGDQTAMVANARYGDVSPALREAASRGNGMMIEFTRGAGRIFHAGTCEWVAGLEARDFMTTTITRNVLDRYAGH